MLLLLLERDRRIDLHGTERLRFLVRGAVVVVENEVSVPVLGHDVLLDEVLDGSAAGEILSRVIVQVRCLARVHAIGALAVDENTVRRRDHLGDLPTRTHRGRRSRSDRLRSNATSLLHLTLRHRRRSRLVPLKRRSFVAQGRQTRRVVLAIRRDERAQCSRIHCRLLLHLRRLASCHVALFSVSGCQSTRNMNLRQRSHQRRNVVFDVVLGSGLEIRMPNQLSNHQR